MFSSSSRSTLLGCATLFSLLSQVTAHGVIVDVITTAGKDYVGNFPLDQDQGSPTASPIWQALSVDPVTNTSTPTLACNSQTGMKASQVAAVDAGSLLQIYWGDGPGKHEWPHDVGPILSYLAPCSDATCQHDDPSTLTFFKIDELGQLPGDLTKWYQASLMTGAPYNLTIPKGVPNGNYILRQEIISLQRVPSEGAQGDAEFYPNCVSIQISNGDSSTTPADFVKSLKSNEHGTFPGAYQPSDDGLTFFAYGDSNGVIQNYASIFPGPAIPAALLAGGNGGSGNAESAVPTSTPVATTSTKVPAVAKTTSKPVSVSATPTSAPATTTQPPSVSNASPSVVVMTVTEVMVITVTLEDSPSAPTSTPATTATNAPLNVEAPPPLINLGGGAGSSSHSPSSTPTPTSTHYAPYESSTPTSTPSVPEPEEDCEDEETSTSAHPTSTSIPPPNRRMMNVNVARKPLARAAGHGSKQRLRRAERWGRSGVSQWS